MEDPWGSPWAAGESVPTIDLSPAPPATKTATATKKTPTTTTDAANEDDSAKGSAEGPILSSSAWEADDDDAWGGWSDEVVPANGNSPGWGRSPALQPVHEDAIPRKVSPDPWGKLGALNIHDIKVDARSDQDSDGAAHEATPKNADSAISFGDGGVDLGFQPSAPSTYFSPSQDVWHGETTVITTDSPTAPANAIRERPDFPTPTTGEFTSPIPQDQDSDASSDGAEEPGALSYGRAAAEETDHNRVDRVDDALRSPAQALPPLAASTEGDHGRESLSEKKEDTDRVARSTVDVQFEGEGNVEGESKSKGENDTALGHSDQAPLKKLSPISVTVDLSAIDRLFPSVKLAKPSPEPVPDVIIDDTFASTSERKAWYRLSRRGPMRMHDLGDEENFVRMDWKSSNVRHDTLVIVRRWMEEDSIAGRVVLGRRGGDEPGSKLFNWDSSAPQVEIGDLLGKKTRKSKEHSRQGSRTSIGSPISPTAATFAWSSPPASPVASVQSPVAPSTVVKPTQPPVDRPKSIFIPPPPAIGRPVSIDQALKRPVAPPITPLGAPQDSTDEEEDDWGEMVASPGHDQRTSLDTAPSAANGLISPVSTASEGKSPTLSHNGANGIINSAKGQSVANAAGFGSLDLLMGGHKKRSQEGQPGQTSNPFPAQRLLSHKRSQSEMVSTPPSLLRADADTKPSTLKAAAHSKADEDEIVAGILADLPDLTYMLRR